MDALEADVLAADGSDLVLGGLRRRQLRREVEQPVLQIRRHEIGRRRDEIRSDDEIRNLFEASCDALDRVLAKHGMNFLDEAERKGAFPRQALLQKVHEALVVQDFVHLPKIHGTRDVAIEQQALRIALRQGVSLDRRRMMRHAHHQVVPIIHAQSGNINHDHLSSARISLPWHYTTAPPLHEEKRENRRTCKKRQPLPDERLPCCSQRVWLLPSHEASFQITYSSQSAR